MKKNFALVLIFFWVSTCIYARTPQKNQKPNIIYVLADDLGYGEIGCYGQQKIKTPHIDQLAKEGMLFTQHYAGSTVCAPSRSALLTGQHTGHTYVRANGKHQLRPNPEDLTIGYYLQQAGYKTAMIGKAGTGCTCEVGQPNDKNFDYFLGFLGHGAAHTYFPEFIYENSDTITFPNNGGTKTWRGDTWVHDVFIDKALKFIDDNKDQPFYLNYSALLPHAQIWAPEASKKDYTGMFPEKPYHGKRYGTCEDPNATVAGMISRLDWEVGQIVEKLEELGLSENTIIMYASDNGPAKVGGRDPQFFKATGDFRGIKRDLYEGGIRIPFIVKWPGKVKANSTSDHLSAFWDVLPTLAELAGVEVTSEIDGISFLPTLKGQSDQKQHDYLYWEFYERGGNQAVRMGQWKAVTKKIKSNPDAPIELYDLTVDPGEENDIAHQNPQIIKKIKDILKTARYDNDKFSL